MFVEAAADYRPHGTHYRAVAYAQLSKKGSPYLPRSVLPVKLAAFDGVAREIRQYLHCVFYVEYIWKLVHTLLGEMACDTRIVDPPSPSGR